jgi:hypothetical protein
MSRSLTGGILIHRVVRSLLKSWPNGSGTSAWSWGKRSLKPRCARLNLLPHVRREAKAPSTDEPEPAKVSTPAVIYGPPKFARSSFTHGFPGSAFTPQPDGTLRCPANHPLYPQERRPERDGSLRILYAARIGHCRSCPLRAQCQESGGTLKPRRVSAVLWPLSTSPSDPSSPPDMPSVLLSSAPVLWRDWPRCGIRRTWLKVVRSQTIRLKSFSQFSPLLTQPSTGIVPNLGGRRREICYNEHRRVRWAN